MNETLKIWQISKRKSKLPRKCPKFPEYARRELAICQALLRGVYVVDSVGGGGGCGGRRGQGGWSGDGSRQPSTSESHEPSGALGDSDGQALGGVGLGGTGRLCGTELGGTGGLAGPGPGPRGGAVAGRGARGSDAAPVEHTLFTN
jgi:hypothetical protein